MNALSVEQSMLLGKQTVSELFDYVTAQAEECTAYQMEQEIFTRVMQIGLHAMMTYFAAKGTGDVGDTLALEDGTTLPRTGTLHGCAYFSVFGKFTVPRTYYHQPGQAGVFPLDAQADLPERCYSYLLQEWMDVCSLRETFRESSVSLTRLLGLKVGASRFEVVSGDSSQSYDQFYARKALPAPESEGTLQVLGFDGKGVPVIRQEAEKLKAREDSDTPRQKKKEAMVGISYTVDPSVRTAEEVAENLVYPERVKARKAAQKRASDQTIDSEEPPRPRAQNIRRMASLERSREEVVHEMGRDEQARNTDGTRPRIVVMDGALALWALITRVLGKDTFIGILDIIHVTEYLWAVGKALYGVKTAKARRWVYAHLLALLQGKVGRVIGGLKQTRTKRAVTVAQRNALTDAIRYFDNHRLWMRYDEYLQAGYPIGSGVVESTCGHTVKDRMEGTGKRWSVVGAESTLLVRSVYTSGDWDAYWDAHMAREHQRLYGHMKEGRKIAEEYDNIIPFPKAVGT